MTKTNVRDTFYRRLTSDMRCQLRSMACLADDIAEAAADVANDLEAGPLQDAFHKFSAAVVTTAQKRIDAILEEEAGYRPTKS